MNFRFLYREDKGRIDRATWWQGAGILALVWLVALVLYQSFGHFSLGDASQIVLHDAEGNAAKLNKLGDGSILIFPATILTIVSIFVAVAFYFVSAKRFQDIAKPGLLALILPLALFITAAIHWMAPQLGAFPGWITGGFDLALLAVAAWTIWELGFKESA